MAWENLHWFPSRLFTLIHLLPALYSMPRHLPMVQIPEENIWHLFLWGWFVFLDIMTLSFTHFCQTTASCSYLWLVIPLCIFIPLFLYLVIHWCHLSWFYSFAVASSDMINIWGAIWVLSAPPTPDTILGGVVTLIQGYFDVVEPLGVRC